MDREKTKNFLSRRYGKHTFQLQVGIICAAFILLLSSCFKGDEPVVLPQQVGNQYFTIDMGPNYTTEYYFGLNSQDTSGTGGWHADWDLAFETGETGFHIWLNGGNKAQAADMGTTDFNSVNSINGAIWKWDAASWYEDSSAIGDWRNEADVYIIDRGSIFSDPDRYWKVIFQSVSTTQYQMEFAHLDGSNLSTVTVPKDPTKSYVYYSMLNGGQLACPWQPATSSWDLLFTRYSYIFYIPAPLQYPVTGVLTKPGEMVAVDSTTAYDSINLQFAQNPALAYSERRDAIGYNWKTYSFSTSAYTVKSYYNYIIHDSQGNYWKLHFLDFYNSTGQKGYPQFEFSKLTQ